MNQNRFSTEIPPDNIKKLLLFISFYIASPILVIPYLGFSYSAPVMFLLMFETFRRFGGFSIFKRKMFFVLIYLFWYGLFLSFFLSIYNENIKSDVSDSVIMMINYTYWCLAGMLAFRLFSQTDLPQKAVYAFASGIIFLSLIVLIEYIGLGGLLRSGWSAVTRLSQNAYGWQFSAFTPFLFFPIFYARKKIRLLSIIALCMVILAAIVNESRGSWIAVSAGIVIYLILFAVSSYRMHMKIAFLMKSIVVLVGICVILLIGFQAIPAEHLERINHRFETLRNLDEDKSYQIRMFMVHKGWELFLENPVAGVGPTNFIQSSPEAQIEIPYVLNYKRQSEIELKNAHNSYILLLSELGLSGFLPFAILNVWLLTAGLKAAVFLAKRGEGWSLSLYTSFVCMSIHLWSIIALTSTAPWFLYGFMAAMIHRYGMLRKAERVCCPENVRTTANEDSMRQAGEKYARSPFQYS